MVREKVMTFLDKNGKKLIIGAYTSYLDVKRRGINNNGNFSQDSIIAMTMENYFWQTLKTLFGEDVQKTFDKETLSNKKYDLLIMQYNNLYDKYYKNHEREINKLAQELLEKIDKSAQTK